MATLNDYLTQVENLLHDSSNVFWTQQQLTTYINEARERTVRDTGCLRVIQNTQTPIAAYNPYAATTPPSYNNTTPATTWTANTAVTAGQYVFSNIYIYQYQTSGTSGSTAPAYPTGTNIFPPSTTFADGTATLLYVQNAEIIPFASLPQGISTYDVVNINLYWGNSRIPMRYLPWTNFTAQLRYWQNYVGRPICFSVYGQQQIYIAPVPDQSYYIEIDTNVLPTALSLSSPNAVDSIIDPYNTSVQYYAAYKAKFYEQSYGEAEIFKQEYNKHILNILNSTFTRRIPDPYSNGG
jgi:hypothetical protein